MTWLNAEAGDPPHRSIDEPQKNAGLNERKAHAAGMLWISVMTRVLDQVRAALRSEPRLDLREFPIELSYAAGTLTLEGEVGDIAVKKLALERAAALPGVSGILDRLRVRPAQRMGDRQTRDLVRGALEPAFADFAIRWRQGQQVEIVREPSLTRTRRYGR